MKKASSLIQMFGESAGQVENDMNKIVGRTAESAADPLLSALSPAEEAQMRALVVLSGRDAGLNQTQKNILEFLIRRWVANGGTDPRTPVAPADGPGVSAGSMLDLSSPINTIVKSIFFLSLSQMFSGTIHFYFISVVCSGAIIYSLNKIIKS